jgi:hypothetical protein
MIFGFCLPQQILMGSASCVAWVSADGVGAFLFSEIEVY